MKKPYVAPKMTQLPPDDPRVRQMLDDVREKPGVPKAEAEKTGKPTD